MLFRSLSDRFGRKSMLLTGLAVSVVAAVLSGLAPEIELFLLARMLEGIGLGAGAVMSRAVLTDTIDAAEIAAVVGYAILTTQLVPALAPIFGGYLALRLSLSGIFFALAIYGAGIWLFVFHALPETLREIGRAHV